MTVPVSKGLILAHGHGAVKFRECELPFPQGRTSSVRPSITLMKLVRGEKR